MELKIIAEIKDFLRNKIGLDGSVVGASAMIEKAVSDRMKDCGIIDGQTYLMRLQKSFWEKEALIEKVIVPETWFFRDREAFNFLRDYIISEWLPNQSLQQLRVLSVPCSTGEEPYSIAIALLEAGLNPNQFQVDAVDISKVSLLKAKRAIYGEHSFRGQCFAPVNRGLVLKKRYFEKNAKTYQLCPQVKKTVRLICGNLIDPFLVNKLSARYHIIFCRNLLIYLDEKSRQKVIEAIDRLLIPNGLLFLGAAETNHVLIEEKFGAVRHPMSFAYRKGDGDNLHLTQIGSIKKSPIKSKIKRKVCGSILWKKSKQKYQINPLQSSSSKSQSNFPKIQSDSTNQDRQNINDYRADSLLENARKLANQGHLQAAAHLCQTYMTQNPTSVSAYVLLGEVYQAGGNDDRAEQCFQKAIYLDPNHYEALMHLALLKKQRGDLSNASILRKRIQRLD